MRKLLVALAAAGLVAVPVTAAADTDKPGKPEHPAQAQGPKAPHANKPPKPNPHKPAAKPKKAKKGARVAYRVRGTVKAVDVAAKTITVTVADKRGATNRRARAWRGTDVVFDVANARLRVRDVNNDGKKDLADVGVGDKAHVLAKLPRTLGASDGPPFKAKRVVVHKPKPAPTGPTGATGPTGVTGPTGPTGP